MTHDQRGLPPIDLLLTGANAVTLDPRLPAATTIAIHQGRILAVGSDEDLAGVRAQQRIDLGGATVVPGFGDAHNHMAWYGLGLDEIDLMGMDDLDTLYDAVAARAATLPPDGLVIGSGYDDTTLGGTP